MATGKSYRQVIMHYGGIYHKSMTMAADTATRFETTALYLNDAMLQVQTKDMLIGDVTAQALKLEVKANGTNIPGKFDLSTLYFKNASAGQNGTITIVGVRA